MNGKCIKGVEFNLMQVMDGGDGDDPVLVSHCEGRRG